jgi:branched-chain amino acid transport system permease protein
VENLPQYIITGMTLGSVYALIAMSFVVVYKCTGIFNMAIGEILMLGAFFCWSMESQLHLPFFISFLLTMVFACLLGAGLERFPFRYLTARPLLAVIIVTLGIAIFFNGSAILVWGGRFRNFGQSIPLKPINIGAVAVSPVHVVVFGVSVMLLLALICYFRFTVIGLSMKATADNQHLAQSAGIKMSTNTRVAWAIAGIIGMVGGVFMGMISGVDLRISHFGLKAIPAAFVGGLDSIPGAIVGGILLGLIECLAVGFIGHGCDEIVAYIILILVLVIRPHGFFGWVGVKRV